MKRLCLLLTILLLAAAAQAQDVKGSVRGILTDSLAGTPLPDATVSLIDLRDSSLRSFTITSASGVFEIRNIPAGRYDLMATFTGMAPGRRTVRISADTPHLDLGTFPLSVRSKMLDEIVITEAPVQVKGDTIAYKADAFKTKPNATVEELLKKLPGVQVDRDGTVRAQGENVQKVYVDGKEFFSNDPKLATKNLTADMVDAVEVYDDVSEQSRFNGIDDGSRQKAINLKLKKDKKKGTFGRANAGAGTDGRYDAGLTANTFKGATQLNIIGRANNTNSLSFTSTDAIGMFSDGPGGGGGNRGGMVMRGGPGMMSGGGGFNGYSGGGNTSGITSSISGGLNYRDVWSPKLSVNGSYFYNRAETENNRRAYRQTFLADSNINRLQNTLGENFNGNHRFNYNLVWNIDSFNSVVFTPNLSFQNSGRMADDSVLSEVERKGLTYLQSRARNRSNNEGSGYNFNSNLIWRHKFRRSGRTLSVNLSNALSDSERDGYNLIDATYYRSDGSSWRRDLANYVNLQDSRSNSYTATASYTEPIGRNKVLELNYTRSENRSDQQRITNDFNALSGKYDLPVDSLSNAFRNLNAYDRFGGNFRYAKKRFSAQAGLSVQQTLLQSDNLTEKTGVTNRYTNFFPVGVFSYQFARSRSLRVNYRGRTSAPSVTQLQAVPDYTRYPFIYIGNPELDQEFTHNITATYNFFDAVRFRNLFVNLQYNATQNRIANSTEQKAGVEITRPVNLNGAYNVSGSVNFGLPIRKLQGGNFNTNTRIAYNRDVSLLNRRLNYTGNLNIGEDLRLSYNYKERLDLGVTASVNYNSVSYSAGAGRDEDYFSHTYSIDGTYMFPKVGLILTSDVDHTFNSGRSDGFNPSFTMWNAAVAKEVLKKRAEVRLSAYDLLNENVSVMRNVTANYIEDVENTALRRFFLLSFTYRLNRVGGKAIR